MEFFFRSQLVFALFVSLLGMAQLRGSSQLSISDDNLPPTQLYFVRHGETHRNKVGERISDERLG